MKFALLSIIVLFSISNISFAKDKGNPAAENPVEAVDHGQHKEHDHADHNHSDQKAKVKWVGREKIQIKVKGMVCAFCAQGVKKNFKKFKEVQSTDVDLDTMTVTVHFKKGKVLDEETIKKSIVDAGFAYGGVVE